MRMMDKLWFGYFVMMMLNVFGAVLSTSMNFSPTIIGFGILAIICALILLYITKSDVEQKDGE